VARRKAGIDDLHFHDLRHEFGSQLLEADGEHATLRSHEHHDDQHLPECDDAVVEQAFKTLEAKRRRQGLKVVRGPQMARSGSARADR